MDNDRTVPPTLDDSPNRARASFLRRHHQGMASATDGSEDFTPEGRLAALATVLQQLLQIVALYSPQPTTSSSSRPKRPGNHAVGR
jgi:hypothetical protein